MRMGRTSHYHQRSALGWLRPHLLSIIGLAAPSFASRHCAGCALLRNLAESLCAIRVRPSLLYAIRVGPFLLYAIRVGPFLLQILTSVPQPYRHSALLHQKWAGLSVVADSRSRSVCRCVDVVEAVGIPYSNAKTHGLQSLTALRSLGGEPKRGKSRFERLIRPCDERVVQI